MILIIIVIQQIIQQIIKYERYIFTYNPNELNKDEVLFIIKIFNN